MCVFSHAVGWIAREPLFVVDAQHFGSNLIQLGSADCNTQLSLQSNFTQWKLGGKVKKNSKKLKHVAEKSKSLSHECIHISFLDCDWRNVKVHSGFGWKDRKPDGLVQPCSWVDVNPERFSARHEPIHSGTNSASLPGQKTSTGAFILKKWLPDQILVLICQSSTLEPWETSLPVCQWRWVSVPQPMDLPCLWRLEM